MIEEIKYTLQALWHRKMRSFLTVISILIGVMAIFAIVSFGLGIMDYMNVLAEQAGTDKIFIQASSGGMPGIDTIFSFSQQDVDYIDKIKGVEKSIGMYMNPIEVEYHDEKKYAFIAGMDTKELDFLMESFNINIIKGRQIDDGDVNKVTVGYNYQIKDKIFSRPVKTGDKIFINGNQVKVVGVYSEVGNAQDDSNVYVTFSTYEQLFPEQADEFGFIYSQVEKGKKPDDIAEKIEDKLRKRFDQEEGKELFTVQTFEDALETFGNIINILSGMLALIALISMIVASVNITNTMYTAVVERTKEIGIMKAVGATKESIMFIFVFESGFLGLIGGVFGVLLGYGVASIGGYAAAVSGYSAIYPIFPWYLISGCLLFATLVGAASGYLPAKQAAALNPVDALRYE